MMSDPNDDNQNTTAELEQFDPDELLELNPPENARTYSSIFRRRGGFSKSTLDSPRAWCAGQNGQGEWMTIDCSPIGGPKDMTLCGIVVQNRNDSRQFVKRFHVEVASHQEDANTRFNTKALVWTPVDGGKVYNTGIRIRHEGHYHVLFDKPVVGRFVRINVTAWSRHIAMRAGVLIPYEEGKSLSGIVGVRPQGLRRVYEWNPPEQHRSYSSIMRGHSIGRGFAQSMLDSPLAWCANQNVPGEYMIINAGEVMEIAGIVAQVRNRSRQAVTVIKVDTRITTQDQWIPVDDGQAMDTGIRNRHEAHQYVLFQQAVMAQYVRITVLEWSQHIAMRAGLLFHPQEPQPEEPQEGEPEEPNKDDNESAKEEQKEDPNEDMGGNVVVVGSGAGNGPPTDKPPVVVGPPSHVPPQIPPKRRSLPPWLAQQYGHAYWKNSWRKHNGDNSPDILCFETGLYGLSLDMEDLSKVKFGIFDDDEDDNDVSYVHVLHPTKRGSRMETALEEQSLFIQVQMNGDNNEEGDDTYQVQTCLAHLERRNRRQRNRQIRLSHARLWEAGQIVQHYEIMGLVLQHTTPGKPNLACDGQLDLVIWPNAFAITLKLKPKGSTGPWLKGMTVNMSFQHWSTTRNIATPIESTKAEVTTLYCSVLETSAGSDDDDDSSKKSSKSNEDAVDDEDDDDSPMEGISVKVDEYVPKCSFDETFGCFVGEIKNPKRDFRTGYTDIRDYDKFQVVVTNASRKATYVPFLLNLISPANVTGLVVMVCDPTTNKPLGIPIQVSKNWHYRPIGNYLRAYTLLPSLPGSTTTYTITVVYAFYGALPSASHANLSLVGWSNDTANGRWEQLAIGSFGETFCLDVEFSATPANAITDVRGLMLRKGLNGRKYRWTNGGWGGDWLHVGDGRRQKMLTGEVKVAYISPGPCLTEVHYAGYYGPQRSVQFHNIVRTLRTDDYMRTFLNLEYNFATNVPFEDNSMADGPNLFRVGGSGWEGMRVPSIAYGNGDGLIDEYQTPSGLTHRSQVVKRMELTGPGPWWIAYNGMQFIDPNKSPNISDGWKALVIRSFDVNAGGKQYSNPCVSFYVRQVYDDGMANLDVLITTPSEVRDFNQGDTAKLNVEWLVLPYVAEDYYGPNEEFREHMTQHPNSWKTVFREAQGNNYDVSVDGGTVKHTYPLIIDATSPTVKFKLDKGVGAVPVRFDGLDSVEHYDLYQVLEGGEEEILDFASNPHQTHYSPETATYSIAFNIPMDGKENMEWVLKKKQEE